MQQADARLKCGVGEMLLRSAATLPKRAICFGSRIAKPEKSKEKGPRLMQDWSVASAGEAWRILVLQWRTNHKPYDLNKTLVSVPFLLSIQVTRLFSLYCFPIEDWFQSLDYTVHPDSFLVSGASSWVGLQNVKIWCTRKQIIRSGAFLTEAGKNKHKQILCVHARVVLTNWSYGFPDSNFICVQ